MCEEPVVVEGPIGGQSAGRDDDDLPAEGVVADDLDDAVTRYVREILVVQILTLDPQNTHRRNTRRRRHHRTESSKA